MQQAVGEICTAWLVQRGLVKRQRRSTDHFAWYALYRFAGSGIIGPMLLPGAALLQKRQVAAAAQKAAAAAAAAAVSGSSP